MTLRLPAWFALRYLVVRKSFHVVHGICAVGAVGLAVGTAAIVVILSVFNGFNDLIRDSMRDVRPDLRILPASGKFFLPTGARLDSALSDPRIRAVSQVLEEQVFLSRDGRQHLARAKGLDEVAMATSPMRGHLIDGKWEFYRNGTHTAVVGISLAQAMDMSPRFVYPTRVYYPSRKEAFSLANPAAALRNVAVRTAGVFSVGAAMDTGLMYVSMGLMRDLLGVEKEVSALEIWLHDGRRDARAVEARLSRALGTAFLVQGREAQDAALYRVMRYEKLAVFLTLVFVIFLVAFNVFSAMRMLRIAKRGDIQTLRALGADEGFVRRVFRLSGWMVCLAGLLLGLVVGVCVVWGQQRFGWVSLPGNYVISTYPVSLRLSDLCTTALGVGAVGYVVAWLSARGNLHLVS